MPSFGIQVYGRWKQGHPSLTGIPASCPCWLPPPCPKAAMLAYLHSVLLAVFFIPCWPAYCLSCWTASFYFGLPQLCPAGLPTFPSPPHCRPAHSLSCLHHPLNPNPALLLWPPTMMARYPSRAASPAVLLKPGCFYPLTRSCFSETPWWRPPSAGGAAGSEVLVAGVLARRRRSGGEVWWGADGKCS